MLDDKKTELLIRIDERQKQCIELLEGFDKRLLKLENQLFKWKLKLIGTNSAVAGIITYLVNLLHGR